MEVKTQLPLSFGRVRLTAEAPTHPEVHTVRMANGTSIAVPYTTWFDLAKFLPAHDGEYQLRKKGEKVLPDLYFMAKFNAALKTWAMVPWKETLLDVDAYEFRGLAAPVALAELPVLDHYPQDFGSGRRVRLAS